MFKMFYNLFTHYFIFNLKSVNYFLFILLIYCLCFNNVKLLSHKCNQLNLTCLHIIMIDKI